MIRSLRMIVVFLMCLVLAACSAGGQPEKRTSARVHVQPSLKVAHHAVPPALSATLVGSNDAVKVSPAKLSAGQQSALVDLSLPYAGADPAGELSSAAPIPAGGAVLTRKFPKALPSGAAGTFAFYNRKLGSWQAVPTVLSPDRRTLTATVHHFSLWTVIVAGVNGTIQGVSDWLYYWVGKIFSTRVDAPSCSAPKPSWVQSATFIATDKNNPLLFCVGHDTKKNSTVVLKARVNRGFGYTYTLPTSATWRYNSTTAQRSFGQALSEAIDIDSTLPGSVRQLFAGNNLVGPGDEVSFGLSQKQAGSIADGAPTLTLTQSNALGFLVTTLAQLIVGDGLSKADGYVAVGLAIAQCANRVVHVRSPGGLVGATVSCIRGLDESVARTLAQFLLKTGMSPKAAGKLAGEIVGRASLVLAVIGPATAGLDYWIQGGLPVSGRSIDVLAKPAVSPTGDRARTISITADAWFSIPGTPYDCGLSVNGTGASCESHKGRAIFDDPGNDCPLALTGPALGDAGGTLGCGGGFQGGEPPTQQSWWKPSFGQGTLVGQPVAYLPNGTTLVAHSMSCTNNAGTVRCTNRSTGSGFTFDGTTIRFQGTTTGISSRSYTVLK